MDIVLTHATCDFDSLAAAVGLARLRGPHCRVVIPAGVHSAVRRYLSLHKSFFPIADSKLVDPHLLQWVAVVDTRSRKRLGAAAEWLKHADKVVVLDHHPASADGDICEDDVGGSLEYVIDDVGAASTLVVEKLMQRPDIQLSRAEATLLALAIHTDTGSLSFENTTPRDAAALAWLLAQRACQRSISQFTRNYLTTQQQRLLSVALDSMDVKVVHGLSVASVVLETPDFVKGMAGVAQAALELADIDALILASVSPSGRKKSQSKPQTNGTKQVSMIGRGRSRVDGVDFSELFQPYGGGGHAKAASASLKMSDVSQVEALVGDLVERVFDQLPPPVLARDFMSTNVISVLPMQTMEEAKAVLFDSGHTGLAVVQSQDNGDLAGVISRQDVALSEKRGLLHTPVKGWVARKVISISPITPLHEIESKLVDNNIGRLPVVDEGKVVGIVTRSDVLIQRHLCSPFA